MLENINLMYHSSIKISADKIIYIDPFKIDKFYNDADIIMITHDHYDHYSEEDFETVPAYNINKKFHPKENGWVGYILDINNIRYYIAGDTDITEENKKVKCDVAFVPVGGTFTMNHKEAANLINEIQPKIAVPTHYGSIVGTVQDATDFIKLLNSNIQGIILMK